MIVISERKLTQEEIDKYREKKYRICYTGWQQEPVIKYGEPVGFIMDTFKPQTIKFIEQLINRPRNILVEKEIKGEKIKVNKPLPISRITAKVGDKVYRIDKESWKSTYYDDKTRKWYSIKNPVLEIYDEQQKIRKQNKEDWKKRKQTEELEEEFGEIPEDLDNFISTFAPLYTVDYDPEDTLSKLRAYQQCKYYLDNDFEYTRDPLGQLPTEEKMFECISFGDETYMQDTCFKRTRRNRKYYA